MTDHNQLVQDYRRDGVVRIRSFLRFANRTSQFSG